MDSLKSSRRGLKSAQKQEDRRRRRNERKRAGRAAVTAEQSNERLRKRRERDRASVLLKLLVKDKLLCREVSMNAKERQLRPLRRNEVTADER